MIRSSLAPANKNAQPPGVKLMLEDGSEYPQPAQLTFVDNAVDRNSGTVRVRAVLPNKDAQLIPGQFIRARVEGVQLSNVVSDSAQGRDVGPAGHVRLGGRRRAARRKCARCRSAATSATT